MDALLRRPLFHLHHVAGEFPSEVRHAWCRRGHLHCCLASLRDANACSMRLQCGLQHALRLSWIDEL